MLQLVRNILRDKKGIAALEYALIAGLIFAAIIGALGGFLPAWSASRKNIVTTMRDL